MFEVDLKIGKKMEKKDFFYMGTRLWNNVDKCTESNDDINVFRTSVIYLAR